jgi:hypothetical protein
MKLIMSAPCQRFDFFSRRLEKIERYTPKAHVVLAPNLDFPGVVEQNLLRRVKRLSTNPAEEGLGLIAYGDETYENFQIKIIGGGISQVADHTSRVVYRPDSILPDANIEQWVIRIASR